MHKHGTVWVVDDDSSIRWGLERALNQAGIDNESFDSGDRLLERNSCKPETAGLLIEMGRAERAPYFHRSWIHLPWELVPREELVERLAASYEIIRAKLPKAVRADLAAPQS